MALSTRSKKTTPALPTQETPVVTLEDGDRESTLSAPTSLEEQIINAREEHERLLKEQELQTLKESNEQLRKQAATGVAIESSITTTSRSSSVSHKRSASGSPHGRDSRHEIRPKNLDPYYGKNLKDHREFVYSAEQAFRMSPSYFPTEERKILWAFQSIKGKIRDAWRAWEAELLHPELVTWEEFADFLLNQVSDPLNRKLDAATAYAKAEQRAGQSIREFSVYLETLEAQIPWYTEEQKIQHLFARLREELQVAITNLYRIPDTKEDLVRLGTTLEDNLRKTAKAHGNHLRSAARGGSPRYNRDVSLVSQTLAVTMDLQPADVEPLTLSWVGNEVKQTYAAYELEVRLTDDRGEERKSRALVYGVDKTGPEVLLGNPFLYLQGVQIDCRNQTWRWRLTDPSKIELLDVPQFEKEGAGIQFLGILQNSPTYEPPLARILSASVAPEPRIPDALSDYHDVFDTNRARTLPSLKETDHTIDVIEGKEPPYGPLYTLSERELKVLREYLEDALEKGWIRHSTSPAGAPILFVPKKDGTLRLCVDYRALNSVTIKDRCPLPLVGETLDRMTDARRYTTLDMKDAYNRIRIRAGDE
ncbi:hypothetical protein ANO11243_007040 [Dothideomycetidae sp. 11243]|nr:hypothetical protein ANO11243_007040 [fungal sp. No.11243]